MLDDDMPAEEGTGEEEAVRPEPPLLRRRAQGERPGGLDWGWGSSAPGVFFDSSQEETPRRRRVLAPGKPPEPAELPAEPRAWRTPVPLTSHAPKVAIDGEPNISLAEHLAAARGEPLEAESAPIAWAAVPADPDDDGDDAPAALAWAGPAPAAHDALPLEAHEPAEDTGAADEPAAPHAVPFEFEPIDDGAPDDGMGGERQPIPDLFRFRRRSAPIPDDEAGFDAMSFSTGDFPEDWGSPTTPQWEMPTIANGSFAYGYVEERADESWQPRFLSAGHEDPAHGYASSTPESAYDEPTEAPFVYAETAEPLVPAPAYDGEPGSADFAAGDPAPSQDAVFDPFPAEGEPYPSLSEAAYAVAPALPADAPGYGAEDAIAAWQETPEPLPFPWREPAPLPLSGVARLELAARGLDLAGAGGSAAAAALIAIGTALGRVEGFASAAGAVTVVSAASGEARLVVDPAGATLRSLDAAPAANGEASCTFQDWTATPVTEAIPPLVGTLAFALGARRTGVRSDGGRLEALPLHTLTLVYDGSIFTEQQVAALLAEIRDLFEEPAAILAA